MGCILYELVVNKPAFVDDVAVYDHYYQNQTVIISLDNTFDESDRVKISEALRRMLHKEPSERPSGASLFEEFSRPLEVKRLCGVPEKEQPHTMEMELKVSYAEAPQKSRGRILTSFYVR